MALLDSEIARLKYELGYNVLDVGADPYVGVSALFEQVIQRYTTGGASTSSSTAVSSASAPTVATLTLADATGFAAGARVVVDVDGAQESATVRSVSGADISVFLSKAHSGTYPVTVEGPESIIRGILQKLQVIDGMSSGGEAGGLGAVGATAGIAKVDEIEFFGGGQGVGTGETRLHQLTRLREYWRDELASVLGVDRLNASHAGGSVVMY